MTDTIDIHPATAEKLALIVDRIEVAMEDRAEVNSNIRDIYAEAKTLGFDTKALRKVVSERSKDRQELEELQSAVELYHNSLENIHAPPQAEARTAQTRLNKLKSNGGWGT